jgi:hypothetical protein
MTVSFVIPTERSDEESDFGLRCQGGVSIFSLVMRGVLPRYA